MHGGYSGERFKKCFSQVEPMNRVVRDAWTAALRSGDYRQGSGRLVRRSVIAPSGRSFCCLGVLCDLAAQAGIVEYDDVGENFYVTNSEGVRYDVFSGILPEVVARWAGLTTNDPCVWVSLDIRPLSDVNDRLTLDFPRIADLIERSL